MNEIIRMRKSIRQYEAVPLDAATLEGIRSQIERVRPLYPDIRYSIEIVDKVKGMLSVKAPHYLLFGSEEKEGAHENIGFIGQQLDLFFSSAGIGACWLGMAKPEWQEASALPHVIGMAFGKPAEPLHRKHAEFKRKPLSAISVGADARIEAARLAPSAVNAQNWFFAAVDGKIHCYRKKPNPLIEFMFSSLGRIDMGIALCHIAEESEDFRFAKEEGIPDLKGHVYMGTVR